MTRLHLALFTSLALHALGLVAAGTVQPLLSGQMRSSLSVQLVGSAGGVPNARGTQADAAQHKTNTHAKRRAPQVLLATAKRNVTDEMTGIRNANLPTLTADTSTAPPTPASDVASTAGDPPADSVNRIKAHLYTDLARHFDYPEMARRRGWEGRVMVAVNVASDGQLQQIRVARSSGFAILDDSALQSLRQVDHITEAVALLNGRRLAMQIPVIYRLQGEP